MSEKSAYLRGVPELVAKLREYGPKVSGSVLKQTVAQAMRTVQTQAAANLAAMPSLQDGARRPRKTYRGNVQMPGFAARHVVRESYLSADKHGATGVVGVAPEAFYAVAFVEMGVPSKGIPARPWLTPAFESNLAAVEQRVSTTLQRRITTLARKHAGKKIR